MRTLITGGLVARTDGVFNADILIEDERILELGERLHERELAEGTRMVDVSGCVVMPGGVDAHTHLNLTAQGTHVSDGFEAGTLAAAWGGTTTVIEHPGFGPQGCGLLHQPAAYREEAEGRCYVDYAFHGVLQHVDGTVLADVPEAVAQGFPTLKAYTTYEGMLDDAALLHILSALRDAGGLLAVHAENDAIAGFLTERLRQEAPLDPLSHPRSRPPHCEAEAVNRVLKLAKTADAPAYIVHLSTAEGLACVRAARRSGQKVIAETCPQYLLLDETAYAEPDGLKYVLTPPLRAPHHRRALWEGLADGSIAVVATDHCSFSLAQKRERAVESVFDCPSGVPGVETRLPLLFSEGVLRGRLTLPRFVEVACTAPARIMGLPSKGRLEPGADADITVIDPSDERLVHHDRLHQRTDSTPYEGMIVRGWPRHVWLRGRPLVFGRQLCGTAGQGRFLERAL